jgi:hypothetical protein
MKNINIIGILLFVMSLSVLGQSTVETPWGTSVIVWTQDDMIYSQRIESDTEHARNYSGAQFHPTLPDPPNYPTPSSSSKFNCHGYAWYMYWRGTAQEFSAPWNMNDTEADNYFSDPSFKECTKAEADIWWINNGAHSALATGTTDLLKSKWGTGPLATHYKDNQPTTISSVTYYKRCSYDVTGGIDTDITMDHCAVKFQNTNVLNYVDLEIEYEEAVLIEGTFTTGTGTTLNFHPD